MNHPKAIAWKYFVRLRNPQMSEHGEPIGSRLIIVAKTVSESALFVFADRRS